MAHTFANLLAHVIFSTKNREAWITPELKEELLPYIGGIMRNLHGKVITSNARPDHYHDLLSFPTELNMMNAIWE